MKLTEAQVLRAVANVSWPRSIFIINALRDEHWRDVEAGGRGHPPTNGAVRRKLLALRDKGMLERSECPRGFYGYGWHITPAGQAALEGAEA